MLEIGAKWKRLGGTTLTPKFSAPLLPYSTTPTPSYPTHSPTVSAPMNRLRRTLTNQNQRCRERYTPDQAWVPPSPSSRPPLTPLHCISDPLKMMPRVLSLKFLSASDVSNIFWACASRTIFPRLLPGLPCLALSRCLYTPSCLAPALHL